MRGTTGRHIRPGLALAAAALLLLSGACDESGGGAAGAGGTSAAEEEPAPGSRLKTYLLPAGELPAGLRANPDANRDSGDARSPASNGPAMTGAKACETLMQTAWIRVAGMEAATFAQADFVDAGQTREFGEEIDTFHGQDATEAMSRIKAAFDGCRSFESTADGSTTLHMRLKPGKVPGYEGDGVEAVLTAPELEGGQTIAALRVGDAVVTTLYSSTGKDKGSAAVTGAKKIAAKVDAGR